MKKIHCLPGDIDTGNIKVVDSLDEESEEVDEE